MRYRREASPLHAARAAAGGLWCLALAALTLSVRHPLVLVGLAAVVLAAAAGAKVGRAVGRTLAFSAPFAVVIALINIVVVRDGLTVLARLGELPPFGQVDLTLEALVYGLTFGLRIMVVVAVFALASAAIDPDQVLSLFRRLSLRSALAVALASRLLPVLAADGKRINEARQCRADGGGEGPMARVVVLRAVTSGALDRALDVAATLEVRGYATAVQRPGQGWWKRRRSLRPWSRQDFAFVVSATVLVLVLAGARAGGLADFEAYPMMRGASMVEVAALLAAAAAATLAPFTCRRGIEL